MNQRNLARIGAAALVFAGAAFLAASCGNDTQTTTTADLQKAAIYDDNKIFSAVVEGNYTLNQVSGAVAGASSFAEVNDFITKVNTDTGANLTTLYGTADINAGGMAATPMGLAASQGLTLGTNPQTDFWNNEATTLLGSFPSADPGLSVALTDPAGAASQDPNASGGPSLTSECQAMSDLIGYFVDANNDGGAKITNDALRGELTSEQTKFQADVAAGTAAYTDYETSLTADAGATGS
jgi:hypothetical protein